MANLLLLFLSTPSKDQREKTYISSDGSPICGVNTNDAPAKYILSLLKSQNQSLDRIICATSAKAKEEGAYKNYCQMISNFCTEKGINPPQVIEVEWDISGHVLKVTTDILSYIISDSHYGENQPAEDTSAIIRNEDGINIYIDATGGLRDANFALMGVVRFLEYSEVKFKKAIYATYPAPYEMKDLSDIYELFNLINAADSFTSYGNAGKLRNYYADNKNKAIRELIGAMNEFSEAIGLCEVSRLDTILHRLNQALADFISDGSVEDRLFASIIEVIRKKFAITGANNEIDYLNLIEWCINNNLLQQAITIYTEKIPIYLYEKGFFKINNPDIERNLQESKIKNWGESHLDIRYQLFWDAFFRLWDGSIVSGRRNYDSSPGRNKVIIDLPGLLKTHSRDYSLPNWLPDGEMEQAMQNILVNYLYIKNYIRNRTNHAGGNEEKSDNSSKMQHLFKRYRYPTVDVADKTSHITADIVTNALKRGIGLIRNVLSKKAKHKRKSNTIIIRNT